MLISGQMEEFITLHAGGGGGKKIKEKQSEKVKQGTKENRQ
jgi:hypothetical protein